MTTLLAHLERLVAFDTQNPPRAPAGVLALLSYAVGALDARGFAAASGATSGVRELGDGCAWLHLRRGEGGPLVNVHVDTVPAAMGWSRGAHALQVDGGRAVGLGACDIKGALAAFLVAATGTQGPAELLLTSDEEAGSSRCVRTFLAEHDVKGRTVLVAEPTRCRAVVEHRGIGTCTGTFHGVAGHASNARALADSAVHEAVRWGARALEYAGAHDVRLNVGTIEGGVKANMIAQRATLRFGVRPFGDPAAVVDALCALAPDASRVTWKRGYLAPALPASGGPEPARAAARALGLADGPAVDFFTEAALFSEAGANAVVFGPGDIAQAHAPDEWVELAQLEEAERLYAGVLGARAVAGGGAA